MTETKTKRPRSEEAQAASALVTASRARKAARARLDRAEEEYRQAKLHMEASEQAFVEAQANLQSAV
jgi:hypothetical protein